MSSIKLESDYIYNLGTLSVYTHAQKANNTNLEKTKQRPQVCCAHLHLTSWHEGPLDWTSHLQLSGDFLHTQPLVFLQVPVLLDAVNQPLLKHPRCFTGTTHRLFLSFLSSHSQSPSSSLPHQSPHQMWALPELSSPTTATYASGLNFSTLVASIITSMFMPSKCPLSSLNLRPNLWSQVPNYS